MKKQLLILVLFMGLFSAVNAQDKKMFAGVNLGFSSDDAHSSFNIGPRLGYWLSDNMALVGGVSYQSNKNKTTDITLSTFGIGAQLRYGWHHGDNTFFYLAPGVLFQSASSDVTGSESETTITIALTPGVNYMLGDRWSINAEIGLLEFVSTSQGDVSDSHFAVSTQMFPENGLTFGLWYHF